MYVVRMYVVCKCIYGHIYVAGWMYVVCKCMYTHMYVVDICMWRVNVYTHTCVSGRFCMYVVWMYVVRKCIYGHIYVCGMDVCGV